MLWEGNADLSEVREIGLNNGSTISVDGDYIYFLQSGGGEIAKYDHTKKVTSLGFYERIPFGNYKADNLIVYKGWVYFINEAASSVFPGSIHRVKTDNSAEECLFSGKSSCFNIYKDHIYFNDSDDDYCIYRMDLDGSNAEKICNHGGTSMVIEDDWIYYLSAIEIRSWKLDGTPIIPDGKIPPGKIYKMRTDGSEEMLVRDGTAQDLNVWGGYLYYTCKEDGRTIHRINTDGSNDIQLTSRKECSNISICNGIIFYKSYELFHMYTDGSEFSIPTATNTSSESPSVSTQKRNIEGLDLSEILFGSWVDKTTGSEEYRFYANGRYEWNMIVTYNDEVLYRDVIEAGNTVGTGVYTFDLYPDIGPNELQHFMSAIYDPQTDHLYIGGSNTYQRATYDKTGVSTPQETIHYKNGEDEALYIPVIDEILGNLKNNRAEAFGLLYDLDDDATRELIILTCDFVVTCSVYDIEEGTVSAKINNAEVFVQAGGDFGSVAVGMWDNQSVLVIYKRGRSVGYDDSEEYQLIEAKTMTQIHSFKMKTDDPDSASAKRKYYIDDTSVSEEDFLHAVNAIENKEILAPASWNEPAKGILLKDLQLAA